ncbi:monovalent cation/H(+) antiporter subunit G [Sediminibacillus albus]|uniref:Multicomponent Na+:H+ antiporter subunit G n=1 Tax=Sediminibacillus albus TaxID=407036 RepID=A0A1G9CLY6_9BACI|nr:monovalent cation/H(+) antiporter subunit G [Sediminibacillus albus]SDK52589.1 multicomponent Na+:H+ antiporter subunit G [Sediminibacillus albus]
MTGINIDIIVDIIVSICLLVGTFFIFSTSIGLLRFPDVYTRMHAATKAPTIGITGIMIGAFLFLYVEHGIMSGKLILGLLFVLLTVPVSGHMISRAAHRSDIALWGENVRDDYAEAVKAKENPENTE